MFSDGFWTLSDASKNVQNIFATVRAVAMSYRPARPRRRFVSFREILYDFVYTGLQPRR